MVLSLTVKLAMPILNRSLAAVSSVLNSRISRLVVSPCPLYWSSYKSLPVAPDGLIEALYNSIFCLCLFEQNSVYRKEGSLTSQWVGTGWVGFSGEGMVKRVGYGEKGRVW